MQGINHSRVGQYDVTEKAEKAKSSVLKTLKWWKMLTMETPSINVK